MKAVLLFLYTVFVTSTLCGQKFTLGSEVGVISTLSYGYSSVDFNSRRNTYFTGLNITYKLSSRVSLSSGMYYVRQGRNFNTCTYNTDETKYDVTNKYDNLAMPLTINFHLLKSRKLIINTGILGAYNLMAINEFAKITNCETSYPTYLSSDTQDFSLIGTLGFGYKFFENDKIECISTLKWFQSIRKNRNPEPRYTSTIVAFSFNYKLNQNN